MAPLVMLAATVAGCWDSSSSAPCQSNENYCDGDIAHSCESAEQGGSRFTTKCDAKTQACLDGYCANLTDVPCDGAGAACDPSGHTAYNVCAKGFYVWAIDCPDTEVCTVAPDPISGTNYAGCAITPFEPCTKELAFCRQNRVLYCDERLGLLGLQDDCNPNRNCQPSMVLDAYCN
jgi:hypothetical protein